MKGWINEWVNEWKDEWKDEWKGGCKYEWMNEWIPEVCIWFVCIRINCSQITVYHNALK